MRIFFVTGRSLAEAMGPALVEDGFAVGMADTTDRGEYRGPPSGADAILLDREFLPGGSYECLLRWRRSGVRAHVLVLLPRDSTTAERTDCLDAGADAYLLQPLAAEELRAHLRVLRRRDERPVQPVRRVHDLEINAVVRSVKRAGRTIRLTPREFELLAFLAHHQGRVVSRSMIRDHLYSGREATCSNVVDVYVRYLRNKIDKDFNPPLILTRWGEGYLLRGENA
jgi:DNA-binding response OmpR family regulator